MLLLDLISNFFDAIDLFDTREALATALAALCKHAGFDFFAVSHHGVFGSSEPNLIRFHNYPQEFADFHIAHRLGARDPVHRKSQLQGSGFLWESLARSLPGYDVEDSKILALARRSGIGDGYTKPFHMPGERSGSCSFAVRDGVAFPRNRIALAEALGSFAFEAARRLSVRQQPFLLKSTGLTRREREIVVLLGHGKPLKQIAHALGISQETVNDHLRRARARFGVHKSAVLIVCALLTGSITYSELLSG